MKVIEQLLALLGILFTGRSRQEKETVQQFTTFVREQLTFLMGQLETFRGNYIAQSEKINALYTEMQRLNTLLTRAKSLECSDTVCTHRQ